MTHPNETRWSHDTPARPHVLFTWYPHGYADALIAVILNHFYVGSQAAVPIRVQHWGGWFTICVNFRGFSAFRRNFRPKICKLLKYWGGYIPPIPPCFGTPVPRTKWKKAMLGYSILEFKFGFQIPKFVNIITTRDLSSTRTNHCTVMLETLERWGFIPRSFRFPFID